jgi:hypothetical protein
MMGQSDNTQGAWLDRLAHWLRVNVWLLAPGVVITFSLILIAMSVIGMIQVTQGEDAYKMIRSAFMLSFGLSMAVAYRQRGTLDGRRDERETAVSKKAAAAGGTVVSLLIIIWTFLLGSFGDSGMWQPDEPREWAAISAFALGMFFHAANFAVAWFTPAYAAELLDEE